MKQLLIVRLYKLTGKEIADIEDNNHDIKKYTISYPEYLFKDNKITDSYGQFQYYTRESLSESQKEESFIFISYPNYCSPLLHEEISMNGFESFINDTLLLTKDDLEKGFFNLEYPNSRQIPQDTCIDLTLKYETSFNGEDYDCDVTAEINNIFYG